MKFAGEDLSLTPSDGDSLDRHIAYGDTLVPSGEPEEDVDLYASDL